MSGPRSLGVLRRGAVYAIRLMVPIGLAKATGVREIRRSLRTADPQEAKRLGLLAKLWFDAAMTDLAKQPGYRRLDLERAARDVFERLASETRRQPTAPTGTYTPPAAEQVELSEARVRALEAEINECEFGPAVERVADSIVLSLGLAIKDLTPADKADLLLLAARVERLSLKYLAHQRSGAWNTFHADDDLRWPGTSALPASQSAQSDFAVDHDLAPIAPNAETRTVAKAVEAYLSWKKPRVGSSMHDEIARPLNWLVAHVGAERSLATLDKPTIRTFRDALEQIDRTLRGKGKITLKDRQTPDKSKWISTITSRRYLASVQAFLQREVDEGYLAADPSAGLKIEKRKGETKRTPEPFTTDELKKLFETPLYAGHKSVKVVFSPGTSRSRGSHFWVGLLGLYTGMRAGEIAQLLGSDFDFDAPVPVIHVRAEDSKGEQVKSAKTASSIRDVPISDILLALGLRQIVDQQTKGKDVRVFRDIKFGTKDRRSDGITKAWARLLKAHGLHKPGRSFHVFRHTATAALRRAGQPEEVIAAILGHAPANVTGSYGGAFPVERTRDAIKKIDYGFDVVAKVGGLHSDQIHKASASPN